jgi:phage tail sheath protein FI
MSSYSYPGIYIQELANSAQTITPTPTSIAAFVGYTDLIEFLYHGV